MLRIIVLCVSLGLCFSNHLMGEIFYVASQQEFDDALDNTPDNDTIVWRTGTYSDIFMDIERGHLTIMAEELGSVVFNGNSRVDISTNGDFITLIGFQFVGGDIGTSDVINTRGSYNIFTQINIRAYSCYKYLRVREESQFCEITYCNFENRLNVADQNILSILVDDDHPGFHKIQFCSFKNFPGGGGDEGVEPIRIGVSSQAEFSSRTTVEYCYFTACDGDGEIISSKAAENIYRYNTFENNTKAELVLRHGSRNIVYGNFFLNGKGGVRVREGQDQYIYNNYFQGLNDRPIILQNDDSDPLDNINIAFNTIVNCGELRLGGPGDSPPTNVTFANNIFALPDDDLFREPTDTETWIGNITSGDLGFTRPSSGLVDMDLQLDINENGFYGLSSSSPAIDAALADFDMLPNYEGIDDIDVMLILDLMKQDRPSSNTDKDVGCNEFPHDVLISPMATEENTGPVYNTSEVTSVVLPTIEVDDLIKVNPNPVVDQLNIQVNSLQAVDMRFEIFNTQGQRVAEFNQIVRQGTSIINRYVDELNTGFFTIRVFAWDAKEKIQKTQSVKFIKL